MVTPRILPIPQHTEPDAVSQLSLKILATLAHESERWVPVHPRGALIARLRLYHLLPVEPAWALLAEAGFVECYPAARPTHIRLTPTGIWQARFPAPNAYRTATAAQAVLLQRLYSDNPHEMEVSAPKEAFPWAKIRTQHPLQWLVLKLKSAHIEGEYLLPDELWIEEQFTAYPPALLYFQSLPPSTTLLLAHTSLTTLVHEILPSSGPYVPPAFLLQSDSNDLLRVINGR